MYRFWSIGALVALFVQAAAAKTVFFPASYSITNNNPDDVASAMANVKLEVNDNGPASTDVAGGTYVNLKFWNSHPDAAITDIWIDNGTYLEGVLDIVSNSSPLNPVFTWCSVDGVSFDRQATPDLPPGSTTVTPAFGVYFSADTNNRNVANGIGKGEWLNMRWKLAGDNQFNDVVHAISNGELRIAMKLQGFKYGGSETLIITPLPPAAVAGVGLFGLVGLAQLSKRRAVA
jgi:hypothetical protein